MSERISIVVVEVVVLVLAAVHVLVHVPAVVEPVAQKKTSIIRMFKLIL